MKQLNDNVLKGMILRVILSGKHYSRDIYNNIDYSDKQSFYSEMNNLKRRGYVSKKGDKKPFHYVLTKKGRIHAKDPFIIQRNKEKYIEDILMNDDRFRAEVERIANKMSSHTHSVDRLEGQPEFFESGAETVPEEQVTEQNQEIEELKKKNEELKKQLKENLEIIIYLRNENRALKNPQSQTTKTTKTKLQIDKERRIKERKKLFNYYNNGGYNLDHQFFKCWKNNYPYRMKKFGLFGKGSVEIISKSNQEHGRGHVAEMLNPNQIHAARFHVIKATNKGITVIGRGMGKPKLMTW